jgi:hypothetical protein
VVCRTSCDLIVTLRNELSTHSTSKGCVGDGASQIFFFFYKTSALMVDSLAISKKF